MAKVGLVVVFNHKYERNLPRLESYYKDRFAHRTYLMPFAESTDPHVIRVIENGTTFGGHIAQGLAAYDAPGVTHYLFLGDDAILNPSLTEENLVERLGLAAGAGYAKSLVTADSIRYRWPWAIPSTKNLENPGFSYVTELPTAAEAKAKFERMGFTFPDPWPRTREDFWWLFITFPRRLWPFWLNVLKSIGKPSSYPLLAGYCDVVIVPRESVQPFARYCGVFAAMNMFAEVGVATALGLACKSVMTELAAGHHFTKFPHRRSPESRMRGVELWGKEIDEFGAPRGYGWDRFLSEFEEDVLYYHPIKLSKWH
jgi:hypothetical protein